MRENKQEFTEFLISQGIYVHSGNALLQVVEKNRLHLVSGFYDAGLHIDINLQDKELTDACKKAIELNNADILSFLINKRNKDYNFGTLLRYTIERNKLKEFKFLMSKNPIIFDENLLNIASRYNQLEMVKELIIHTPNLYSVMTNVSFQAVMGNSLDVFKFLYSYDNCNHDTNYILKSVIELNKIDIFNYLIEIEPNIDFNNIEFLKSAFQKNNFEKNLEIIEKLYEFNKNKDEAKNLIKEKISPNHLDWFNSLVLKHDLNSELKPKVINKTTKVKI